LSLNVAVSIAVSLASHVRMSMARTLQEAVDYYLECAERMPESVALTEEVELWVDEMSGFKVRNSVFVIKLNWLRNCIQESFNAKFRNSQPRDIRNIDLDFLQRQVPLVDTFIEQYQLLKTASNKAVCAPHRKASQVRVSASTSGGRSTAQSDGVATGISPSAPNASASKGTFQAVPAPHRKKSQVRLSASNSKGRGTAESDRMASWISPSVPNASTEGSKGADSVNNKVGQLILV
jgi:hypothetical protein